MAQDSQEIRSILSQIGDFNGRRLANLVFPNDVEVYFCALELIDSKGVVEDYFLFPIMPSQMDYDSQAILNIKKTATSVVSITTDSFVPYQINISGNFGRTFKILVRKEFDTFFKAYSFSNKLSRGILKEDDLSTYVKSGYGCYKILERIYERSCLLDSYGSPKTLIFYNPSINKNVVVKINGLRSSQNESNSNMIWAYNLRMTAVSDVKEIIDKKNVIAQKISNLTIDFLQKSTNNALKLGLNLLSR